MFKSSIIFLPYSFFMKPSHFHVPLLNPSLCFQWRSLGKSHPQTMAPWYTGDLNVAPNSCQVLEASVWQSFVSENVSLLCLLVHPIISLWRTQHPDGLPWDSSCPLASFKPNSTLSISWVLWLGPFMIPQKCQNYLFSPSSPLPWIVSES